MDNDTYLIICAFVFSSLLIFLYADARIIKRHFYIKQLLMVLITMIVWLLGVIMMYTAENPEHVLFWHSFRYIGICFLPVFVYKFLMGFLYPYRRENHISTLLLSIIPFFTVVLAFTSNINGLVYTSRVVAEISPRLIVEISHGMWFYVYMAYAYIIFAVTLAVLVINTRKATADYFLQISMTLASYAIAFTVNLLTITNVLPMSDIYDYSPIGLSFAVAVFFAISRKSNARSYLPVVKDAVFNTMSNGAVIIDETNRILQINKKMADVFGDSASEFISMDYDEAMGNWMGKTDGEYLDSKKETIIKTKSSHSIDSFLFFRQERVDVTNSHGDYIASFLEFVDVTQEQRALSDVFVLINKDSLTGLYNNKYYAYMLEELDTPENYPLGILSFELNELKSVNDSQGYEAGDKVLLKVADILLKSRLNDDMMIFRTSGVKFSIIMPKTSEQLIAKFIDKVSEASSEEQTEISVHADIRNNPGDASFDIDTSEIKRQRH